MNKLLSVTAITFLALAASALAAPDSGAIMTAEKNAWAAVKDKNFDAFQKMLAPDFRGVYPHSINNVSQELTEVRSVSFQSVKLGKMDVVFIDSATALVTYGVTVKGTASGKDISGKEHAASVWKKDGKTWRVAFHTDMPVK